jgi:hypothetical protein
MEERRGKRDAGTKIDRTRGRRKRKRDGSEESVRM